VLRYKIPIRMSLEILPASGSGPPIIMNGFCRDLSVSGISFLAVSNGAQPATGWPASTDDLIRRKVRITIPAEDVAVAISGMIVRKRSVSVQGHKTHLLGIEFAKMTPRLRGAFFAFAENAKDVEPSSRL
jgi:hypothetical protein